MTPAETSIPTLTDLNAGGAPMPAVGEESSPVPAALPARAVTVGEVARFAKRNHNACRGQGFHMVLSKPGDKEPHPRPCSCAINRFLELYGPILERKANGELHWQPGKGPAATN